MVTQVLWREVLQILSRFLYSPPVSRSFIKKQDLEMKKFSLCHCHSADMITLMYKQVFVPDVTQLLLVDRQMAHLACTGTVKYTS